MEGDTDPVVPLGPSPFELFLAANVMYLRGYRYREIAAILELPVKKIDNWACYHRWLYQRKVLLAQAAADALHQYAELIRAEEADPQKAATFRC